MRGISGFGSGRNLRLKPLGTLVEILLRRPAVFRGLGCASSYPLLLPPCRSPRCACSTPRARCSLEGRTRTSLVLPFTRNRFFVDLVHCESSSLVPLSVSSAAAAFTFAFLDGACCLIGLYAFAHSLRSQDANFDPSRHSFSASSSPLTES